MSRLHPRYFGAIEQLADAIPGGDQPNNAREAILAIVRHAKEHPDFPAAHREEWSLMVGVVTSGMVSFPDTERQNFNEVICGIETVRLHQHESYVLPSAVM